MMNRMKVFGADSVEAMAKITRDLGGDARIYSTRRVNGGIEIIAGKGDDDESLRPQLRPRPSGDRAVNKQKVEDDFATLLASARKVARAGERFKPIKVERDDHDLSVPENNRLSALEESVAEIKSMLGCSMMTSALTSAGASPELIAIYLAQAGAHEKLDGEKKFGNFPSYAGYTSYDDVFIIAEAIKRAGSTDSEKLVDAMENQETITGRLEKAHRIFGDRIRYAGPDCGLGLWPDASAAARLLENTAKAIAEFNKSGG